MKGSSTLQNQIAVVNLYCVLRTFEYFPVKIHVSFFHKSVQFTIRGGGVQRRSYVETQGDSCLVVFQEIAMGNVPKKSTITHQKIKHVAEVCR